MRFACRGAILLSLGLLVCFSVGCGSSPYATPEATFETAKKAMTDKDYKTFCGCLTPECRDDQAAGLVLAGSLAPLTAQLEGTEEAKADAAKATAVIEKHGLTQESTAKILRDLATNPEDRKKGLQKLVEPIKDRDAFIAEFFSVTVDTAGSSEEKVIVDDAKLTDLKTDGDTTTATCVETREGSETKKAIAFKKIDGQWKISDL
ncbi:MAG: hypothetical protein HQ567_35440 [Candidatus Nealsonbacteria bacterium]|nr:hypothetical protein [Candidatus Nealsonbacteria bacterium]